MRFSTAFTTGVLALTAAAMPFNSTLEARDDGTDTFRLHVWNNCPWTKQVALYSVTSDFQMQQRSTPTNIAPNQEHIIHAPFKATGMRLSGHAEMGTDWQWNPQALFEFGYSEYDGQEGTAYDLSLMAGSDPDVGMGAYVIPNNRGSETCKDFTCFPWDCPPDQGWTNPDQVNIGSPADTVCYKGKTAIKVVYCP